MKNYRMINYHMKQYFMKYCLWLIVMVTILGGGMLLFGCGTESDPYSTSASTELTVTIRADKSVYYIGEKFFLTVQASLDSYLTLYSIDALGRVTQIFPNQFASDNLLLGGEIYRIPGETDEFDFEVNGPAGTEQVWAVVVDATDPYRQAEDIVTFQVIE